MTKTLLKEKKEKKTRRNRRGKLQTPHHNDAHQQHTLSLTLTPPSPRQRIPNFAPPPFLPPALAEAVLQKEPEDELPHAHPISDLRAPLLRNLPGPPLHHPQRHGQRQDLGLPRPPLGLPRSLGLQVRTSAEIPLPHQRPQRLNRNPDL